MTLYVVRNTCVYFSIEEMDLRIVPTPQPTPYVIRTDRI